uniref:Branchpoint-bridging protein n=1 Tax=Cyanistes caeruleus TaxID=156563 RepID=A0A8C0U4N2_CYACU
MIRGKGSVKEGKVGRKDGQMLPGEDEPLHALVTANTMENVKKAVEQIRNILKQGIETPEDQNDLRKMQLRELARLNGTLREDDNRILRPWQSTETRSITNTTVCTKCGGAGHIASDCKFARPGDPQSAQDKARMDKEYLSLMAELGEAPVSVSSNAAHNNSPLSSSHRAASQAGGQPPPVSDTPKIPPLGAPRAHLKQPKISPSSSPGQVWEQCLPHSVTPQKKHLWEPPESPETAQNQPFILTWSGVGAVPSPLSDTPQNTSGTPPKS